MREIFDVNTRFAGSWLKNRGAPVAGAVVRIGKTVQRMSAGIHALPAGCPSRGVFQLGKWAVLERAQYRRKWRACP